MATGARRLPRSSALIPPKPTLRSTTKWFDDRIGSSRLTKQLTKVFPDHWSFMLGEITLYCFVLLLVTGVYLTLFFEPSAREVIYNGSYEPLRGTSMSAAFASSLDISFEVRFGLVMRQMHHWSALLFVAAMVLHLLRVFFTGAYRKPRELNWLIGVALLILAIANGFLGYSLLDDLLSGTGIRVAYWITNGIPVVGTYMSGLVFGDGEFPPTELIPRFYGLHILLLPAVITGLLSAHLGLVWFQKHTQFRGPARTENNVVGSRLFPTYGMKAIGLFFLVTAVVGLMGGVAQINPIWVFGPLESAQVGAAVSSASQPDWYMGWLDGLVRLFPGWEFRGGGFTVPNAFFAAAVIPGVIFGLLFAWPFLEPLWTKDRKAHNLLDRPRDVPLRTGIGAAALAYLTVLLLAGSNDVLSTIFNVSPESLIVLFRVLVFVAPVLTYLATVAICRELRNTSAHPALPGPNHAVVRTADGGYQFAHGDHNGHSAAGANGEVGGGHGGNGHGGNGHGDTTNIPPPTPDPTGTKA